MLNNLVKILKENGYEAFIVTHDGNFTPWLIDHQNCISINQFNQITKTNQNIRCITSWAIAHEFIKIAPKIYFWDMEMFYTDNMHYYFIKKLQKKKAMKVAGVSSPICFWHMNEFKKKVMLLTNWIDNQYWKPNEDRKIPNRIGFMRESDITYDEISFLEEKLSLSGINFSFHEIKGNEIDCIAMMQTCEYFLGMNHGKDNLWGEGFGLPMLEAMSTGSIVISYDITGNREYILHNFNGYLVKAKDINAMHQKLIYLANNENVKEEIKNNAMLLLNSKFTPESRWESIKNFLDL